MLVSSLKLYTLRKHFLSWILKFNVLFVIYLPISEYDYKSNGVVTEYVKQVLVTILQLFTWIIIWLLIKISNIFLKLKLKEEFTYFTFIGLN